MSAHSSTTDEPSLSSTSSKILGSENIGVVSEEGSSPPKSPRNHEVEGFLETHEVIELQAFIERKVWIEDKIQFLESLTPVNVFAGMDQVPAGREIHELVTRAHLNDWVAEHDRIEKETEMFDSGDLKKLKKFTKAATQRNLSPEDTDLIELTLTTLYSLDKLLHLLRGRSEDLELMTLRLSWEEHRLAARSERLGILQEMEYFFSTHARWSPATYSVPFDSDTTSTRRGSVASFASDSSTISSQGMSRSLRFRLAELLSRDAAQYSSKIINLRHNKVTAAAKVLDKLIDNSRKPIPEPILDEQDKIEDICGTELENVGKFAMSVVMQWKKADEIYIETKKDQASAQTLIEEIEVAKLQHAMSRQDALFMSRGETLSKRLSLRTDPSAPSSLFPRPLHPLFPQQAAANDFVIQTLAQELAVALELNRRVEALTKDYHETWQAVKRSDQLLVEIRTSSSVLSSLTARLEEGFPNPDDDGTAPDILDASCLEPLKHSAYLAMMPSTIQELELAENSTRYILQTSQVTALSLRKPGIGEAHREMFLQAIQALEIQFGRTAEVKLNMLARVAKLRDLRRVWSIVNECSTAVRDLLEDLKEVMTRQRWRRQSFDSGTPMTPESPSLPLPPISSTPTEMSIRLDELQSRYSSDVLQDPLLSPQTLSPLMTSHFKSSSDIFSALLSCARNFNGLWSSIREQDAAMKALRDDVHKFECRLEELRMRYDDFLLDSSLKSSPEVLSCDSEADMSVDLQAITRDVDALIQGLTARIPLVSRQARNASNAHKSTPDLLRPIGLPTLPFDNVTLDVEVRTDCNAYVLRLAGCLKALEQKQALFSLRRAILDVDSMISTLAQNILECTAKAESKKILLQSLMDKAEKHVRYQSLAALKEDIIVMDAKGQELQTLAQTIRQEIHDLWTRSASFGDSTSTNLINSKSTAFEEVAAQMNHLVHILSMLKTDVDTTEHLDEKQALQDKRSSDHLRHAQTPCDMVEAGLVFPDVTKSADVLAGSSDPAPYHIVNKEGNVPFSMKSQDVLAVAAATTRAESVPDAAEQFLTRVRSLRNQLQQLAIHALVWPSPTSERFSSGSFLPTQKQSDEVAATFSVMLRDTEALPMIAGAAGIELRSLRIDLDASGPMLRRLAALAKLSSSLSSCDAALSDLLDHIDSFPSVPLGLPPSSFVTDTRLPPEGQLSARLEFTRNLADTMRMDFSAVVDDPRAAAEHTRITQTWNELLEMATDRITGVSSRPASVQSSGRDSRAAESSLRNVEKKRGYSQLSVGSRGRGGLLTPKPTTRSVSSTQKSHTQLYLHAPETPTKRSVSGPMVPTSSLYRPTFASRQRTTSITSSTSSIMSPSGARTARQSLRVPSPTVSETSTRSLLGSSARTMSSRGTWSRAPRQSFGSISRVYMTSEGPQAWEKRTYIANPKNKLDVAVGDIVNRLPVNINVEVVADTWKDQSGKYWIGDTDPKLCFCRILRSRTVMVRVGGGWSELSKFIKDHYADRFRLLPESPRLGSRDEKWISSSILLEARESPIIPPLPPQSPRTPEPRPDYIPTFAVQTPEGKSPKSVQSQSSPGSPLTPLQFLRRADAEPPSTPLKATSSRVRSSVPSTPARVSIWRP